MRRRLLGALLLVWLLGALSGSAAAAGDYTVRIYAGQQGTMRGGANGGDVLVYHRDYGERVTFNLSSVELKDGSKYYVKGLHESGKDIKEMMPADFPVTRDQDYVVVYGILGDAVAYTINYVDWRGNQLAPSETYYGNVGDRPVVAYLSIDGYIPRYYNLTATLSANAAENVFDFVYVTSGRRTGGTSGLNAGGTGGGSGSSGGSGTGEAGGGTSGQETGGGEEEPPFNGTEEIRDLDVPLALYNGTGSTWGVPLGTLSPEAAVASGVGVGAMALLLILWFVTRRRKKEEQHEQ
ncbi:MAG: hypothetical protein IJ713_00300 [Oscillibacter sp.]|nr:hypothetical protein [Oscillibacter sp.]